MSQPMDVLGESQQQGSSSEPLGAVERGHAALRRQFPHVEAEAITLFVEDAEGQPSADALTSLAEMQAEVQASAVYGEANFLPTRRCMVGLRPTVGANDGTLGEELQMQFEGGDDPPRVGTNIMIEGLANVCAKSVAVAIPDGRVLALELQEAASCFLVSDYGMHELRVVIDSKVAACQFRVTSELGDFAEALDHFHDACDWVWDGNWTENLEEATMSMLSALDDYFESLEAGLQQSPLGGALRGEVAPSRRRLENSLAKALEDHDAQSVGRIYGGVRSFLQSQTMLDTFGMLGSSYGSGPLSDSPLYHSVLAFERERFASASEGKREQVRSALFRLITAADAHACQLGPASDFTSRWHGGLRDTMIQMNSDPGAVVHPLPFQQLRGGGTGQLAEMMKGMLDSFGTGGGSGATVQRSDTLEAVSVLKPESTFEEADSKVSRWDESLVDEAVPFGSPLSPFVLHNGEPWVHTVMSAMQSILSLGLAYVSQGDEDSSSAKLVALLDRDRATLPLRAHQEFLQDKRRRDRLKDVCRLVRAARKKGQRLSLSVNTDFAGALRALKEHHSDSWVGPNLEAVWSTMAEAKRAFAFELWLHDDPQRATGQEPASPAVGQRAPRLIAADFGHPHTAGLAYYVTTRFFDREFRTLQPGFILAFAEAECMRRAGFELWDLGGADKSPMMSYKPQVAIEMGRSAFLRRLRECRRQAEHRGSSNGVAEAAAAIPMEQRRRLPLTDSRAAPAHGGDRIPTGVVFPDISEEELWGATALRAQEESLKAAEEAAKKAAKKVQKLPKAKRKAARTEEAARTSLPAAQSTQNTQSASPQVAADMKVTVPPQGEDDAKAKAAFQQRFMVVFQDLLTKGLSRNDAAAQAVQIVAR